MRQKTPHQAEKILAAAARLFASHRFHEARMEDIAALADVGKGTLYRYFDDKEKLYLALLDQAAEALHDALERALAGVESPREQLVAFVGALLAYFDDQPHVLDLIQHAEAMQKPGTEFPWQKTRNETMALVRGILVNGGFDVADPDLGVLMLLGGLRAVVRFGEHPRRPGLAEEIVTCYLEGHRAEARLRAE